MSVVHKSLAVKNEGSGTATAAVTVKDEVATDRLREAVRILAWTGAIGVEFIKDKSGTRYLIDANPRICGQSHLSTMAGVNLAYHLVQLGLGKRVRAAAGYRTGLAFIRTWRDEVIPLRELERLSSAKAGVSTRLPSRA